MKNIMIYVTPSRNPSPRGRDFNVLIIEGVYFVFDGTQILPALL